MSLSTNDDQDDQVTAMQVVAEHGWVFLRAVVKEGSFWLDSGGRLWWWRADFERAAAEVRRKGGAS
jgi:hypothetical protein